MAPFDGVRRLLRFALAHPHSLAPSRPTPSRSLVVNGRPATQPSSSTTFNKARPTEPSNAIPDFPAFPAFDTRMLFSDIDFDSVPGGAFDYPEEPHMLPAHIARGYIALDIGQVVEGAYAKMRLCER